ncbi:hypothetical protein JCM11672_09880 [Alkaliphilus crotonatoxidans]
MLVLRNKDSKLYTILDKVFLMGTIIFNFLYLVYRDIDIFFNLGFIFLILILFLIATKEVIAKGNKKGYLIYILGSIGLLSLILKAINSTL